MTHRRSANAAVVRELQTKIDQGENVDFEIQVIGMLIITTIKMITIKC